MSLHAISEVPVSPFFLEGVRMRNLLLCCTVNNWTIGILFYLMQLVIIGYIVGFQIVYKKGNPFVCCFEHVSVRFSSHRIVTSKAIKSMEMLWVQFKSK